MIIIPLIIEFLKNNIYALIVAIIILLILLINIFSKFLQNLDYLRDSLSYHISNWSKYFKSLIKWIIKIIFLPITLKSIKNTYKDINSKILNNSVYKDVT